jgi:hypothetical protein
MIEGVPMQPTSRTALAVVVAALALIVSAGAGATAARLVTGKDIKNGTVTSADVKNKSLKPRDFSARAKSRLRGPTGATGATGATGPQGAPGISGFEVVTRTVSIPGIIGGTGTVAAACPAGKKAISANAAYAAPLAGLLSQVTRTSDTAFEATGLNTLAPIVDQTLTLDVVCATIPA